MKKRYIYEFLRCVLAGIAVGVGAILPGVSGGVLCVAFGFYEPLMELLTHPVKAIRENFKLYIPFGIGGILGFFALARAIEVLFRLYPTVALMLFFGLICGSLPELFRSAEVGKGSGSWTPFVLSLSLSYLLFHILGEGSAVSVEPGIFSFAFCGVLWGISVVVPGFTSSAILISLGLFEPFTGGVVAFDFGVLLPFAVGMGVTVLLLARLVHRLFKQHYALMMRIILGFVIASSLEIVPAGLGDPVTAVISLLCFAAGFFAARVTDLLDKNRDPS